VADDTEIIALIQELMEAYDSSISTSEGSAFYKQVVTPILRRIGGDPLESDIEGLIVAHLEENIEGIDVSPQSGVRDLIVRPLVLALEPWTRELQAIKNASSLANYESMTRAEVNDLLANYFTELEEGTKATVSGRVYFNSPQTCVVTPLSEFSTGSGLNFYPTETQTITSTSMSFNQEGGLYYFDVSLEAEFAGSDYNIGVGELNTAKSLPGAVRVTNKNAATVAEDDETKLEGITRAQESITIRNLSVLRGVKTVLQAEYSSIDDIEVVGKGDPLMLRDVIYGPVSISYVPGGIYGSDPADIGSGRAVHVGGMTDVWLFTTSPTEETIDINNPTDKGIRLYAGTHGMTDPAAPTNTWLDEYGRFTTRGVQVGDVIRYGEDEYGIISRNESSVNADTPACFAAGISGATYEIVRYDRAPDVYGTLDTGYYIDIPLYDLVATDAAGDVVEDVDGDTVLPTPGDLNKSAWIDGGGSTVKTTENIADTNILLPYVRVKRVAFLAPLDSLVETGDVIPLADVLQIKALSDFSGGGLLTKATGTLRFYFKDAVNVFFVPGTYKAVTDGGIRFQIDQADLATYTCSLTGTGADPALDSTTLTVNGDVLGAFSAGDRVEMAGVWWTLIDDGALVAGPNTEFSIRELEAIGPFGVIGPRFAHGILEADMTLDSETGLYYIDVPATCTTFGVAGNISEGELLSNYSTEGLYVEGYTMTSVIEEYNYSTRELPVLRISRYVNDDKDLQYVSTAYAIRVYYDHASGWGDIQSYVDSEDNRPVGEDILIRHMLPNYVFMDLTMELDADAGQEAVIDYLMAHDPSETFEMSDLVDELYEAGAEYLKLPVSATVLMCGRDRKWTAEIVTDTHTTDRTDHYVADEDSISVTES
jgi:hypothetical protein